MWFSAVYPYKSSNPIAELDCNDSLLARFVYGSKAHVPDYVVKDDTIHRIITDHLGSVRAVVNVGTGEVVQELSYNEFGNVLYLPEISQGSREFPNDDEDDVEVYAEEYLGAYYDSIFLLMKFQTTIATLMNN